ncbi:MAG: MFS transporter, partial [Sphingomonadaceae bacterium]|nr:MFS transporter [Sphingomonadaceae bacterium]
TASGSFLMINNLIGIGVGPMLMGWLSDRFTGTYGDDALLYATVSCLGFYLLASVLALLATRTIRRDWVDEDHAAA